MTRSKTSDIQIIKQGEPIFKCVEPTAQSTPATHPDEWQAIYQTIGDTKPSCFINKKELEAFNARQRRGSTSGSG